MHQRLIALADTLVAFQNRVFFDEIHVGAVGTFQKEIRLIEKIEPTSERAFAKFSKTHQCTSLAIKQNRLQALVAGKFLVQHQSFRR